MVSALEKLAEIQLEHTDKLILICLIFTAVMVAGIPKINIQTDFQEGLPDDLPPIEAEDKVESNFGNTESLIVVFKLTESPQQESTVTDIRDPRVLQTLNFLESELDNEPIIKSTNSMAALFQNNPDEKEDVKNRLSTSKASFTNRDYSSTTMFVELNEEMNEENVKEATKVINENLNEAPMHPGVEATVTGTPAVRAALSDVILTDSTKIIGAASIVILALLTAFRGFFYGPATFLPLFLGLVWALGAMGWIGLPLTIVTISLASMLLGLGVEYASFIAERIREEKAENGLDLAVRETMPYTGKAVLGSSVTDLVGFLSLLLASISFIRDLGLTLAIGEGLTLLAAIALTPALIVKYERWNR